MLSVGARSVLPFRVEAALRSLAATEPVTVGFVSASLSLVASLIFSTPLRRFPPNRNRRFCSSFPSGPTGPAAHVVRGFGRVSPRG
jgi:hypothetical protein